MRGPVVVVGGIRDAKWDILEEQLGVADLPSPANFFYLTHVNGHPDHGSSPPFDFDLLCRCSDAWRRGFSSCGSKKPPTLPQIRASQAAGSRLRQAISFEIISGQGLPCEPAWRSAFSGIHQLAWARKAGTSAWPSYGKG